MPDKYKWVIVTAEAYAGVLAFISLLPIFFTTLSSKDAKNPTTLHKVLSFLYALIDVILASFLVIISYC